MNMAARRSYRMVARADATAATSQRILDAAVSLFYEQTSDTFALTDVAGRAGVSVQTVIRHFGGRDGLIAAATARETERVRVQRDRAPAGDVDAALHLLVEHYEELGDAVVRMLAAAQQSPSLGELTRSGSDYHHRWCERVFGEALGRRHGAARTRALAQLVAVCDVYTWHVLRRRSALTRQQTELALRELVAPLLED